MGSCEIVEEKDEVRLAKHYGKSVLGSSSKDLEWKQRECDIDKLFQSIPVRPSTRLLSSSFHNIATSASAGPSRTTSPSNRIAMKKPGTPQSPRVFGLSDSVSLKQALRDRCISKASEMAAQKRLSKSAAASPRVSEADRIKSLYIQVSNESSRRSKGKASLVEMPLMPEQDKPSSSRSVPPRFEEPFNPISELSQAGTSLGLQRLGTQMQEIKPLHKPNKSCLSSDSGDSEIELDENVTSLDDDVKEVDKHVTSLPSYSSKIDNATELEEKTLSSALEYAASSVTEKSKTVRKVTRMIPRPKQQPKKKILVKKKIKIGIVSVTNTTKKDEETESSLDSSSKKLICQRCHSSLKSTSIDNPPPSYTTSHDPQLCSDSLSSISNHVGKEAHQVADENFSGSCNVSESSEAEIVVTKPAVTSSNNSGNSARDEKEAENNPTSSEKFEFSLSSKDSLGDYSRSTSMSEGSNISRFSCGNKPHMSMDVRWEAIKHVKLHQNSRMFSLAGKTISSRTVIGSITLVLAP